MEMPRTLINASILLLGSKKEAEGLSQPRCDRKWSRPAGPCVLRAQLEACSELQHGSEGIKGRTV